MREFVAVEMVIGNEEITIDGYVHYHVESDYGADADGARGVNRIFVDDVEVLQAYSQDGRDFVIKPKDREKVNERLTNAFMEGI